MTLGQNIARLRTQKNLSQGDLADALEVSRQSVSKWETDASIPELDKLLRLAELFGVTLDELVKGESAQPEAARGESPDKESAGAYTAAAPAARRETRQIVGTILLCFGALIGILIMLFAGTLAGFILALPLFVCGTICLTVRRRTGLWCAWALYVCFALYMRFAAGVVAGNIFQTFSRLIRLNPMRLAMSWSVALALLALVACTLRSYRTLTLRWERRSIALLTAGWLAQLGIRQALALWVRCIVNAGHGDLTGYTWKLALSGFRLALTISVGRMSASPSFRRMTTKKCLNSSRTTICRSRPDGSRICSWFPPGTNMERVLTSCRARVSTVSNTSKTLPKSFPA